MIRTMIGPINEFASEDIKHESLKTIIEFAKRELTSAQFGAGQYTLVLITSHETDDEDYSIKDIVSLVKTLTGENTLVILPAYFEWCEIDSNDKDQFIDAQQAIMDQVELYSHNGFIAMDNDSYKEELLVPMIYGNVLGNKIYTAMTEQDKSDVKESITKQNETAEERIKNAYKETIKEDEKMIISLAEQPVIQISVRNMWERVYKSIDELPITVLDRIYLYGNSLTEFLVEWDNFKSKTRFLDNKSTAELFDIQANLITAGHNLAECYKNTKIRLSVDDFELIEEFRNALQAYTVERVTK